MTTNNFIKGIAISLFFLLSFFVTPSLNAQCVSSSAPSPAMGAGMNPQFVNLWKMAGANDKFGSDYGTAGQLAIGDDGWPIASHLHGIRYYPNDVLPKLHNNDVLLLRYKGPASAVTGQFIEAGSYQNIQANTPSTGYTTAEIKLDANYEANGNGFAMQIDGRITDIQIIRPGYTFDDPRLLVDEYISHAKHWKAFRFMGISGVNGSYDMTWAKRLSKNAPIDVNKWQTSFIDLGNTAWNQLKTTGMNENSTLAQMGGGRQRGISWEDQIDICNALNIDMWINIPVLVDDDYVRNLAALIKERLKPSLNVNVEIGNELWNRFGPTFMSGYLMTQQISWEFKWGTAEQKKIFGGSFCSGCNLSSNYDEGFHSVGAQPDNSVNGGVPYDAWQRWMARRLKEHAESFSTVFGWRESGGDVGNRIRMILSGQIGYGSDGMAWNIGPGLEFLMNAYGTDAPHKYLYAVAVTGYTTPGTGINSTVNQIVNGEKANINSQYAEFSDEAWGAYFMGNKLEGVFGKARMFGLKMFAYEGGNEISTAGVGGDWSDYTNGDAYFSDQRSGDNTTLNLTNWYSWFGYDALFMKNGDYQQTPLSGYAISRTLSEATPIRTAYINMANGPAPAMSSARGGVIGVTGISTLDARKVAAYWSNWNTEEHKTMQTGTNNWQLDMGNTNTFSSPMLIRCQKNGNYKLEFLVNEYSWNKKADIYLNEVLVKADYVLTGDNSLPIAESAGGNDYHWGTTAIQLDIPVGVHALRVVPKTPVLAGTVPATRFAAGAGDDGYACWETCGELAMNRIAIRKYRFTLSSALPPFQPKPVIGDMTVCKGNNKAQYEVGENDPSACKYEWTGLPPGAAILDNVATVPATVPATYSSGPEMYKIFIDWANVEPGTYTMSVVAKNMDAVNNWQSSPARTFTVTVQTCGFSVSLNPVCVGLPIDFVPEPMTNIKSFIWDNGKVGAPNNQRYYTYTTAQNFTVTYATPGVYSVTLKTIDNSDVEKFYYNTANAISCTTPQVVTPLYYCLNAAAIPLTATGANLMWYTAATGGTGTATAPTPLTTVAGTASYWVSKNEGIESDRAKIDIVTKAQPVTSIITGNATPNCSAPGIAYSVTYTAGSTYAWTVPVGATVASGQGSSSITVNFGTNNGNVSVVETKGGCVGVQVDKPIAMVGCGFVANFTATPSAVCAGSPVTFASTTTGVSGSETYAWNFGANATPASSTLKVPPTVTYTGPSGNVSLTVTDGVSNTKTIANCVTVTALPTAGLTSSDADNTICTGTSVTFTATGGTTYEFFVNGVSKGAASATATYTTTTLTTGQVVTVKVGNAGGCFATSAGITTTVTALPTAGLTSSDADNTICAGTSVTFTATGGTTYEFFVGAVSQGAASGTATFTTTTLTTGQPVTVKVGNAGGCFATSAGITTTVTALPTAGLTSSDADNTICAGTSVTFTATGGTTYEFFVGAVSQGAASGTATFTTTALTTGQTVTVKVGNAGGCFATSTGITTTVNPIPATSIITGNSAPACSATGISYSVTNTVGSSYAWTAPTDAIIIGQGSNSITVNFGTTNGNISVIETNISGCIGNQISKVITLSGCGLGANFTSDITSVCDGSSVVFTNTSTGITGTTTYNWNFGANASPATAIGIGPHTVAYSVSGSKTVSLTVADGLTNTKTSPDYITVIANNTITRTSVASTETQTPCINTAIIPITYLTTGADGATVTGLPDGVIYTWVSPNVTISGTPTTVGAALTYTVLLTGGCGTANATGTIEVKALPITAAITGNSNPACGEPNVAYSVPITAGSTYAWTAPADAIIIGQDSPNITVNFGTTSGNISVVETNSNDCVGAQVDKAITLSGCGLVASFSSDIVTVCDGSDVVFTNTSLGITGATNYSWNFGANATPATATGIGPHTVTYSGSGSSTVSLAVEDGTTFTKTIPDYITIIANKTIVLTSLTSSEAQTPCINTAIVPITYSTTGVTSATVSGLPTGVNYTWSSPDITISGTPTESGAPLTYTVTLTGSCGNVGATGTIEVNALPVTEAITGTSNPACSQPNVAYSVNNTIGSTYAWTYPVAATITGQGSNSITVNFGDTNGKITVVETNANGCVGTLVEKSITLSGCALKSNFSSDISAVCNGSNVTFTDISSGVTGATTYNWNFGTNAMPATATGIGPHSVTYSGSGSSTVSLTVTDGLTDTKTSTDYITIIADNTITQTSVAGTETQSPCINTAITPITYSTTGATNATVTGLPDGVNYTWTSPDITIAGTPTVAGIVSTYTVTLIGGCGFASTTGTIAVTTTNAVTRTSAVGTDAQTQCINTPITNITYLTTGATGATVTGLPAGVDYTWSANVVTISGTATESGLFAYNLNTLGGCGMASITGTLEINPDLPVSVSIVESKNNICTGNSVTFTATPTNGGSAPSYQWYKGTTPVGTNSTVYTDTPANADIVKVVMNSNVGCASTNLATSNSIYIVATSSQDLVQGISSKNSSCFGANNGTITAIIAGTGNVVSWMGPAGYTSNQAIIYDLSPGMYSLKVTSPESCVYNGSITITEPDELIISTILMTEISEFNASDGEIQISVNGGTPPYIYNWKKDSVSFKKTMNIANLDAGKYTISVSDVMDCTPATVSYVMTQPQSTSLNTFTPNGDGSNDLFMEGSKIKVFNRNGVLMHAGNNGWDGKYRGKDVSNDTYFYEMKSTKSGKTITGYVKLVR